VRDADRPSGLVRCHAEVVVEDDDRPVLDRQALEHAGDLVAVGERAAAVSD